MSQLKRQLQSFRKDDGRMVPTVSILGEICDLVGQAERFSAASADSARAILRDAAKALESLVQRTSE